MRYYVYGRHYQTGREEYIGIYDTMLEAIQKIAFCYHIDSNSGTGLQYYYFMKQH